MIIIINEVTKIKDQINNLMTVREEKKNPVKNENIIHSRLMKNYNMQIQICLQENLVDKKLTQIIIIKLTIVAKMKILQNIKKSLKGQIILKMMKMIKCQLRAKLYQ